jgi:hypothetical protein
MRIIGGVMVAAVLIGFVWVSILWVGWREALSGWAISCAVTAILVGGLYLLFR